MPYVLQEQVVEINGTRLPGTNHGPYRSLKTLYRKANELADAHQCWYEVEFDEDEASLERPGGSVLELSYYEYERKGNG